MCPACLAIAAITATGAASAGGISIAVFKTLKKSKSEKFQPSKENPKK